MTIPAAIRGLANTSGLLDKLLRRSLIGSIYPESPEYESKLRQMLQGKVTVYAGFDATADSLHIGNLATIMNLVHFHRFGHRVVCVIGDATTQIGDPSGHTRDREKINCDLIESNASSIEETLQRIFRNHDQCFKHTAEKRDSSHSKENPIIVRNSSWYNDKNVISFVGEIFREVRVSALIHKKFVKDRLDSPEGLGMSEFCYQIFQAYDWYELRNRYDCRLQVGGNDQTGNIYTGHDLVKKLTGQSDCMGLLTPLITSDSGKKLGKSSGGDQGSIWLTRRKTSPYELYQFFHRTPDQTVERYLKVFSLHDDKTIEDLIYNHLKKPQDVWFCQRKLAEHVCQLIHGEAGLDSAKRISHAFFGKNPLDVANLSDEELEELFEEDSIIRMLHTKDLRVIDLVRRARCFSNDSDAEYAISAGAVWLNGARVTSINVRITPDLIIGNGVTLMRIGKKNYYLFKWAR